jgi:hypothetical protein
MTLVDYYQVISETSKTVIIRQLEPVETSTGFLSGKSVPSSEFRRENDGSYKDIRAYKRSNEVSDNFYVFTRGGVKMFLYEWDGVPRSYNHCD